ncbi:NAD(P)-binding protein [Xylariaceae sp. AK1471]|nr:NAD(P)-binding protein [Xylariaceae sp. AK1471]
MNKVILVTGATGKQGGAVINALLKQKEEDFTILAVTRNISGSGARRLKTKSKSIRLVQGDLDYVPALFREAHNVAGHRAIYGVYSVQVSTGKGVTFEGEIRQGKELIHESIHAGVEHFVYGGVERGGDEASWENKTPIPHFQSKYQIEHYLREQTEHGKVGQDMGWTILRPVAFMDNLAPGFPTKVFMAVLRNWLGNKPVQWVATSDIGVFAAKAFINPTCWNHRAIGLAGDELNFDQISKAFENATGYPVPVTYWFFGSALIWMVTELALMIGWFVSDGYRADVKACRSEYPEMLTMEKWLIKQSPFETKDEL